MAGSHERLQSFLQSRGQNTEFQQLSADASTREYFRIDWDGYSAIACVYPESFDPAEQTYLDVTKLFLADGLPVADIMDFDGPLGVIIEEDFGNVILRDFLESADAATREARLDEAVSLIARIQGATEMASRMGSIASKLRFDEEKLLWELDYFKTHYFETFLDRPLPGPQDQALVDEFTTLCRELESRATVLCHRDFHSANLMIDRFDRMRIIDHQDARIGSPTYDLVSLLLDRVNDLPSEDWISAKQKYLLTERDRYGLGDIDETEFAKEFALQTIQRCLKAAGTFSYQSAVRGKTHFVPFIKPMFRAALRAIHGAAQFPILKAILEEQLNEELVD